MLSDKFKDLYARFKLVTGQYRLAATPEEKEKLFAALNDILREANEAVDESEREIDRQKLRARN